MQEVERTHIYPGSCSRASRRAPGAAVIADGSLGADSLDRENSDLAWRQFGYCVWSYAIGRGRGGPASGVRSAASIVKHAAVNCHPYSLRG